jgi:hypothetical protein
MMTHKIKNIRFDKGYMFLTVDGKTYKIKLADVSAKLNKASEKARIDFKVSASGYGIHWAQLDEDLSVDGLIKQAKKSLGLTAGKAVMAHHLKF